MTSKAKADNQNIQVFVRVRPSNAAERKSRSVVELKSEKEITVKDPKNSNTFKTFTFNNVFGPNSSQVDVYCSVVRPLIDEVLSGYNCTVFAYGQTGTGKTFTMEGECSTDVNVTWEKDPLAGIVPRTLSQLFDELRLLQVDFSVKVSFLELYNEELFDLLSSSDDMPKLRIFEDSTKKGAVILSGLEEVSVHSKNDVYNIMKRGSHRRQTASTLMNARSSRSHTVFTVTVHIKESANEGEEVMRTGKMNLVDLAGSENIGRSGAVDKRAREAGNINQSLLTLGRVITALVDRSPHIPYRESKLTRILQESLGGRTKTSIIATVSPAACNLEETLSTLDYAHRAKNIQNKPEINQRLCKKTMLKEYSEEIERLQRDLEATRQRTGVYLDQAEYDNMMVLLDQLAVEVKEKEEELISLQQEMEKKQAICDELFTKTQAVKEAVKERTAFKDEQVSKLVKLRAETSQISTDISEKDYLMLRHMETLESLSSQTNTLHKTTVDSTQSVGLLYDKMDRVRTALQRNESAIENFVQKNNSIVGESKAIIEENSVSCANSASELKTVFKKNLTSMGTHYSDIDSALKGFEMVQDHASSLCQAITEVHGQEPSLKVKNDEIQANHQSAYSKYRGRLNDLRGLMETTKQYLSTDSDTLMDLSLQMNMECGAANEILQEWTCGQPLSDLSSNLTTKVENAVKTINTVVKEDDVFVQEYANLQKMSQEKFGAVLKLVAEIESIGENMNTLVNARNASVDESANAVLNMVEEAKETVKSAIDNEKGKVESTLNQVHHQLDSVSQISSKLRHLKCFKGDVNSELLPLDVVSQEGRKIVMASDLLKNSVKENLDSVANNYEQLTEFHDSCAKEIVSLICTAQRDVKEHTNNLHSSLELFKADVHKEKEVMNDIVRSVEEPLSKQVQDYENSLDLVQSLGAKPSTPTGKTPLRSDVQIPRDLPATSPHQRILSRLRSKYNIVSKMNAEDSPSTDSAYSDVESDFNISEMDLSANKENSFIERESSSSEKSFQSYLPKPRKPLANNN